MAKITYEKCEYCNRRHCDGKEFLVKGEYEYYEKIIVEKIVCSNLVYSSADKDLELKQDEMRDKLKTNLRNNKASLEDLQKIVCEGLFSKKITEDDIKKYAAKQHNLVKSSAKAQKELEKIKKKTIPKKYYHNIVCGHGANFDIEAIPVKQCDPKEISIIKAAQKMKEEILDGDDLSPEIGN